MKKSPSALLRRPTTVRKKAALLPLPLPSSSPFPLFLLLLSLFSSVRRTISVPGNCIAGGSGYGISFDWNRADTVGLFGPGLPPRRSPPADGEESSSSSGGVSGGGSITVEFWYRNTNLMSDYATLHAYSAYNIRGYQDGDDSTGAAAAGGGGDTYEAGNEVHFGMSREHLWLWRGTDWVKLEEDINPRAATYTSEWRHYAFTIDEGNSEVALYVDGDLLDLGTASLAVEKVEVSMVDADSGTTMNDANGNANAQRALLVINNVVKYKPMPFSSFWDRAEHPDAIAYYGTHKVTAVSAGGDDDCFAGRLRGMVRKKKPKSPPSYGTANAAHPSMTMALIRRSVACSEYEKAKNWEEAGAWGVIFEERADGENNDEEGGNDEVAEAVEGVGEGEEAGLGEGEEDNIFIPPALSNLSIPALSVSPANFSAILSSGSFTLTRTRQTRRPGTFFGKPIERNGVLHLGQEPDAPWGDFDRRQAANGVFDEYRIWAVARTPEQIRDNYRRSIDVNDSNSSAPSSEGLSVYWKFDGEPYGAPLVTPDSAPGNARPGLLGGLPTVENQMTFLESDGKVSVPPTSPDRIPTTSSPLIGDGEVVVPAVPGGEDGVVVELKSLDPDGDDLVTVLTSVPASGTLWSLDGERMLSEGDEVDDRARSESKRVVYHAPPDLAEDGITFSYSVSDGGEPVNATVRVIPHRVFQPESRTIVMDEDDLFPFSLAAPSQLNQMNVKVQITALPERGTLYQAQFNPTAAYPSWKALSTELDQYGPMERIEGEGTYLDTDRGIVMYRPNKDEHSSPPGDVYASFSYRLVDPAAGDGVASEPAVVNVVVRAINDPPVGTPGHATVEPEEKINGVVIALKSTDVDADAVESFAERPFARIVSFPMGGHVYQYDDAQSGKDGGGKGEYMDTSAVPQTFAWASSVIRFSSQYSLCGDSCFTWKNPKCLMNDILSGGNADGTCVENAWHASNILGEPNFFPAYADAKVGFNFGGENSGHEFIELEYPYPVYISGFQLYETFKPGALWRISTTDDYVDDTERHCTREDTNADDVPTCTMDTDWQMLWTKPREMVALKGESAHITGPPMCPSMTKTRIVRLDFDTARVPGWNNYDAAQVQGTLDAPRGMLSDPSNRFVYIPLDGVHGEDRLTFAVTDCLDESEESEYSVTVLTPEAGAFSLSAFSVMAVSLDTTPGTVVDYALDLTSVLEKVKATTEANPMAVGRVWHTTAIGAKVGKTFAGISLSNATIDIPFGTETVAPSKVELWLEDVSGLTFRIFIVVKIYIECEHGTVDQYRGICVCTSPRWAGSDCTVEVSEDRNEIAPAVIGLGYTMFAANVLIILACLFGVIKNKERPPVRAAQPFFLHMLLFGALVCNSTIVTMQIEESDAACGLRPWLWSLGFSIMFGSLFAKVLRIFKVFKYGQAMRKKEVTVKDTLWPVMVILAMNATILICWTVIDPLQWVRTVETEDGYGYVLSSYGQCASNHVKPYLASIATLNGSLMVVACFMSYKARHLPSEFHESQHISLAVFCCTQVFFIGIPVLIIVGSDPTLSAFTHSAVIFLTTCAVLLLIFWPILSRVYRGKAKATVRSNYRTVGRNVHRSSALGQKSAGAHVSGFCARQIESVPVPMNHTAEHAIGVDKSAKSKETDFSGDIVELDNEEEMCPFNDDEVNGAETEENMRVKFRDNVY